jgi:glutamyl-tRNA(Gln) amidotransferase subunit E
LVRLTIIPTIAHLKVGFEIHQQLATNRKLFCNCRYEETEKFGAILFRKFRPTQSELGAYDPAAVFEFKKGRTIKYYTSETSSCLVEADEEPPQDLDKESLESALIISLALHSNITDELHVMRKVVIDGSNTCGFQRTILVAKGGYIDATGKRVNVQSICLEEDSARLISDDRTTREYGLDRLGVPLIEIALEPVTGTPEEIMRVALATGRLLRASKRVARGLGTIRQDVNISVDDGAVVEIKGVQKLDQLVKVIEYEIIRQRGLNKAAQLLRERKVSDSRIGDKIEDVTEILATTSSNVVKGVLQQDTSIFRAIRVGGFGSMLGFEPYPDVRIGKELSELVRFYGLGGVFHSDELPNYGIKTEEVQAIKNRLSIDEATDAFVIVGGPKIKVHFAIEAIILRLKMALNGVPAETRSASAEGKTLFSRPKPGAARLYPETDIPPIPIGNSLLTSLSEKVPLSLEQALNSLIKRFNLNKKLAEQIFDSDYFRIFMEIASSMNEVLPTFVASKLTEDIVSLERRGLDSAVLTDEILFDIFKRLDRGMIAKESVNLILEKLMSRDAATVDDAIGRLGISSISDEELEATVEAIIKENMSLIAEKKMAASSMLMGKIMTLLRGRADGHKINSMLINKLGYLLISTDFSQDKRRGL